MPAMDGHGFQVNSRLKCTAPNIQPDTDLSTSIFGRPLQVTVRPMLWDRFPVCPVQCFFSLVFYFSFSFRLVDQKS